MECLFKAKKNLCNMFLTTIAMILLTNFRGCTSRIMDIFIYRANRKRCPLGSIW